MFTHVATTLKKPTLFCSFKSHSAPAQVGPCLPLAVRRRAPSARRFRTFATSQGSPSPSTKDGTTESSTEGYGKAKSGPSKQSLSSSGRDFLKFAFELHGVRPQKEPARGLSKEEKEKRAVGREAEAEARGFLPLMPLPEAPKYPCPYLSAEEINKYLPPLYDQGWRIGSSHFTLPKHVATDAVQAPELAKEFFFAREHSEAGIAFIEEVERLQSQENHHCTVLVNSVCVHVRIHTHSARPLAPASTSNVKPQTKPGITLRDVRLATLLEEAFRPYLTAGTALWRSQLRNIRATVRPMTVGGIERLRHVGGRRNVWAFDPACPVCGQKHRGEDCPQKHEVAPPSPCRKCGQMHWQFLCDAQ